MAGGWRSVSKSDPCPICLGAAWCRRNDDGNIMCKRYWLHAMQIPSGWEIPKRREPDGTLVSYGRTKGDGQVFVRSGEVYKPISQEKRQKDAAEEQRRREKASRMGAGVFRQARGGDDHERVRAYIEARGINLDRLPQGKVPRSIRYLANCVRMVSVEGRGGGGELEREELPAAVCGVQGPAGTIIGVQRIYLSPSGKPCKVENGEAKKALGSISGGAVRLAPPARSGVLILCEGVETGLAIQAAVGDRATVWCCVSTSGLTGLVLPPDDVDEGGGGGWIRRIIVAADNDVRRGAAEYGPGEVAARICINQLGQKHKHIGLRWEMPRAELAPDLFGPDGKPAGGGKSIDWLDVYTLKGGPEMVLKGVMGEWANATAARAILEWPSRVVDQAREVLMQMFAPAERAASCWCLAYWNDEWWVCPEGGKEQWRRMPAELLEARVKGLMDRYVRWRGKRLGPLQPTKKHAAEVLHTASMFVGCTTESMPCWLPKQFDARGEPLWKDGFSFSAWKQDGFIRPEDAIATTDGLIDVEAWVRRELVIAPPSPRWFSANACPVRLPVERIREAMLAEQKGDDDAMPALVRELAPTWLAFLDQTFEAEKDNGQSVEAVQRWFGYCLTPDVRLQKLLWLQGPPGTGKGTVCDVLTTLLGEDAVVNTTIDDMAGKFDTASMVGRRVCFIPEARVGKGDSSLALNRLLSISANDRVGVEGKYMQKVASVRLNIKFVITPNEEPRLHDNSVALLRRLIVVPTTSTKPAKPDPDLPAKLKAEIVGVFLWALLGLRAMRMDLAEGKEGIPQPGRGLSLLKDIERESSPVRAFVQDCCVIGPSFKVRSDLLRKEFELWAETNGHKPMADATFGKALRAAVPGLDRVYEGSRAGRHHSYIGLRPLMMNESATQPGLPMCVDLSIEDDQRAKLANARQVSLYEKPGQDPFHTPA